MTLKAMRPFWLLLPILVSGCAELDALRQRTGQQSQQIAALQEENKQFQEAYYQIKSSMDNTQVESLQKLEGAQRDLEVARNERTQRENEAVGQLRTRSLELDAVRAEMTEQKRLDDAQIAGLRSDLQNTGAERDAAMSRLSASEEQLRSEKVRTEELTRQSAQLTVDLKTAGESLQASRTEVAAAQGTLQETQAKLAATEKSLAASEAETNKAKSESAAAAKQAQEAEAKLAEIESAAAASKDSVAGLQKQLADAKAELEKAKSAGAAAAANVKPASLAEDAELVEAARDFQAAVKALPPPASSVSVRLDARGLHLVLPSDHLFKPNAVVLADDAAAMIEPVVKLLKEFGSREVRIEGHTDDQPIQELPFADNWGLGFARADRVREFLMDRGVASARLTPLSRASAEPLSASDRAINRRVEIVVGK